MADRFPYCITNRSDMSFLFTAINLVDPHTILDIGMLLKRIGTLSRQVMDAEFSADCLLDGADCMPDLALPVYHAIYNHIVPLPQFLDGIAEAEYMPFQTAKYDLTSVMRLTGIVSPGQMKALWSWVEANSCCAITDYYDGLYQMLTRVEDHSEYEYNGQIYSIIFFR